MKDGDILHTERVNYCSKRLRHSTCVSMLVVGLTGDKTVTPSVVADYATQNHYVDENNDTTWAFMTSGVEHWGPTCRESNGNESEIAKKNWRQGTRSSAVCVRETFTDIGHFIILTPYNNGNVTICDPFSLENSKKSWNYSPDQFSDQSSLGIFKIIHKNS